MPATIPDLPQLDGVCNVVKADFTMEQFYALLRAAAEAARRPGFELNDKGLLDVPMPLPRNEPTPAMKAAMRRFAHAEDKSIAGRDARSSNDKSSASRSSRTSSNSRPPSPSSRAS